MLLDFFHGLEDVQVVAIVDQNVAAPGMARARELGLRTAHDVNEFLGNKKVDLIVEVTGRPEVRAAVLRGLAEHQHVISAQGARLMCAIIEKQAKANATRSVQLSEQFDALTTRLSGAVAGVDTSLGMANDILRAMRMIVVNASIEAARLGNLGAAFAIIASELKHMVGTVEAAVTAIAKASGDMTGTLADVREAEKKVRATTGS